MLKALLVAFLAACAAEPAPARTPSSKVAWRVYTHSGCDGARLNDETTICVAPSARDAYVAGDDAANQYAGLWRGSCLASEGKIGAPDDGTLCADPTGQPLPFECSVEVAPTFESCSR